MRRLLALLLCVLLLTGAGPAPKAGADDGSRAIEIASVPAPVFADGKLLNYFFVTVHVVVADGQSVVKLRERAHFVRDALVRRLHETSIASPATFDQVDEKTLKAVVAAAARQALGEKAVGRVEIIDAEPLRRR